MRGGVCGSGCMCAGTCTYASLVPRPSASRACIAYMTFEPLSDSWQKAWYHSYVIYKQSGHGYEATRLHVCFRVYIDTTKTAT